MPEAETAVDPADVIALPPSEEGFDGDHVGVLLDLVSNRLQDYVRGQVSNDEPVSLLGFALELIYQTGYQDAVAERRGRRS